jgi:GNAT superfamily N-acetyltransferase
MTAARPVPADRSAAEKPKSPPLESYFSLGALVETAPAGVYEAYPDLVPPSIARGYLRNRVERSIADPNAHATWTQDGNTATGLAVWSRLAWDSEQFGFQAARLDWLLAAGEYRAARQRRQQLLDAVLLECKSHRVSHLTARTDAADLAAIHALGAAGFELLDGVQTLSLRVPNSEPRGRTGDDDGIRVAPVILTQVDDIVDIARHAYEHDRFHADCAIPPAVADQLHAVWLRNSCRRAFETRHDKRPQEEVLVAVGRGQVLGYVTTRIEWSTTDALGVKVGTIVLVATAASARGQGVGRVATMAAVDWFRRRGVAVIHVGTQLRNLPAARLYESCGFRQAAASLTLRKLV